MGFIDDFFNPEAKRLREQVPLNEELLQKINQFVVQSIGKPYISVAKKEADTKKRQIEEQRKKQREEYLRKAAERSKESEKGVVAEQKPVHNVMYSLDDDDDRVAQNTKPDKPVDSGIRYSISPNWIEDESPRDDITPELDRKALSMDAERFQEYINLKLFSGEIDVIQAAKALKKEKFADLLLKYIQRSGMTNAEIYKRANISKSVFSAILIDKDRLPKKNNIIALALALKLNLKETETLLMKAGYTFSNSIVTDLVVVYCINHHKYDIDEINRILYELKLPLLGSKM